LVWIEEGGQQRIKAGSSLVGFVKCLWRDSDERGEHPSAAEVALFLDVIRHD
jgi:hypothetical protein